MKRYFLYLALLIAYLFLNHQHVFAQQKSIEELKQQVLSNNDSLRFFAISTLITKYNSKNMDSVQYYLDKLKEEINQHKTPSPNRLFELKRQLLLNQPNSNQEKLNLNKELVSFALQHSDQIKLDDIHYALINLAQRFARINEDSATHYWSKAEDMAVQNNLYTYRPFQYSAIGDFKRSKYDYYGAIEAYHQSLESSDYLLDTQPTKYLDYRLDQKVNTLFYLGVILAEINDLEKVKDVADEMLSLSEKITPERNNYPKIYTYELYTHYYDLIGDTTKSIIHLEKALEYAINLRARSKTFHCHLNLGGYYVQLNKIDKAKQHERECNRLIETGKLNASDIVNCSPSFW